jgi:hypothetical protein
MVICFGNVELKILQCSLLTLKHVNKLKLKLNKLGCFTNAYPFSGTLVRPIGLLPQPPEKVGTFFTLYSRKITLGELISASNLTGSNFNPSLQTKFITHGFLENGMYSWIIELKEALLELEDVNVIVTDWVS